jgi:hypothetical protein
MRHVRSRGERRSSSKFRGMLVGVGCGLASGCRVARKLIEPFGGGSTKAHRTGSRYTPPLDQSAGSNTNTGISRSVLVWYSA